MAITGRGYHSMARPQSQSQIAKSEPTRVVATDKGPVTSGGRYGATRRLQEQLGAKYDMNANRVNRFNRAQAATARSNIAAGVANRAVTRGMIGGGIGGIGGGIGDIGGSVGGFGGLSGSNLGNTIGGYGYKWDNEGRVTQTFSSGPRLR